MKKRTLGNSAIEISELSFGCMSLPTNLKEAKPIIERAIEHGINYFDTADLYDKGVNEKIVGESLKPYRNQIVLATKVGNVWDTDGDTWHWDASPAHIEEGLKNSLARLKTDYIDLYQLHGGTIEDSWDEIIDTFEPFIQNSHAVSNMMQYSILDRRPEEWFDFIEDTSSSVVTRGSIAKGLLTSEWKSRLEKSNGYMSYTKEELQQLLLQLEETFGDLHATAIAFNLCHPVIASTVIGA
ncbi:Aldo/keto reductase, partial [Rhizophagus irregularis]